MPFSNTRYVKITVSGIALSASLAATANAQVDSEPFELGTIVVQADLIGRDWKRTGTSFEVLNADELEGRPATDNSRDVFEDTTNVSLPTGTAKAPTIRGVDGTGPSENANAFFAGSRPRLGFRIDGRPAGFNELVYSNASLWDVERIELLRGPQSTLVGRNAIAGTLSITTKDPVFQYASEIEASGGTQEQRRLAAMVNFPVFQDSAALRFAADWQTSESVVDFEPFPGQSNPGEIESLTLRAKMLAYPDLGLGSTLRITTSHNSYKGPQGEIIVRPFEDRVSNFPAQPVHEVSATSIGLEFDVELENNLRFELDTSYIESTFDRRVTPNTSNAGIDASEFSIDPRFRFTGANGLEALVGLHFYKSSQDEEIEFVADQAFNQDVQTYAIYAEAVVPLNNTLEFSIGARYENEDIERSGGDAMGAVAAIDINRSDDVFLPRLGLNWQPDDSTSYGMNLSKGYNSGGGGIAFGSPNPLPIVQYEYEPETVWNFEIYGRQEVLGDRLRLTQNMFYAQYSDMQLPFDLTPLDTRDELFVVRNADRAVTYGAEFGAAYQLNDFVNVFGNVGLLKTDIESFPNSGVEGNELFNAPSYSANLGAMLSKDAWTASVTARLSDGYYTGINNRPRGKTDPYVLFDSGVSYDFENISVFAEVKNLFDEDGTLAFFPGATEATDNAVLHQPRSIVVGLNAKF